MNILNFRNDQLFSLNFIAMHSMKKKIYEEIVALKCYSYCKKKARPTLER